MSKLPAAEKNMDDKRELTLADLACLPSSEISMAARLVRRCRKMFYGCMPADIIWRVKRAGINFHLRSDDQPARSILKKGYWERQQILHFFNAARRRGADTLLDIGANFGYYSLLAAKTGDFADIHAIEPHPETHRRLLMQIGANGWEKKITPHNIAASDKDGTLFIDRESSGGASVSDNAGEGDFAVQAARLDSVFDFAGRNIAVKIDVQGHELAALKGMANLLSRNKAFLQVEIEEENTHSLNYLIQSGFRCTHYIGWDFYFTNDGQAE